jgi:sec-independent protein translocase protein TatA
MGDIGIPELLIILAIILVLFGPHRLAGLGAALGRGIREFRASLRDDADASPAQQSAQAHEPSTQAREQ